MGTYYTYTCGSCGRRIVGSRKHFSCNYCGINLCEICNKSGLCPTHNRILTSEEGSKLNSMRFQINLLAFIMRFVELFAAMYLIGYIANGMIMFAFRPILIFLISTYFAWFHPIIMKKKRKELRDEITRRLNYENAQMGVEISGSNISEGLPKQNSQSTFNPAASEPNTSDMSFSNQNDCVCRYCGASIVSNAKFCKNCGAPVQDEKK